MLLFFINPSTLEIQIQGDCPLCSFHVGSATVPATGQAPFTHDSSVRKEAARIARL
ncbi:hypothetical protein PSAB6_270134 [Paraburkholderia sabiae]|nr:hypothetical protein PSAB6_270134 [Paraburkholderia sabiae]